MKKVLMLLAVGVLVISFNACTGGPEKDIDKMLKLMETATTAIEDAVKDEVIEEGEAEKINAANKDIQEFADEMDEKYEGDDDALAAQEEILEEREEEIQEATGNYFSAYMEIMSCEGADLIDVE